MRKQANRRALAVIRSLRCRQEKQSQKIDILCRDMVDAHRHFAVKLSDSLYVHRFYEGLLACSTLEEILDTAIRGVLDRIEGCETAVFLLEETGFDIHRLKPCTGEMAAGLEDWFTRDLVQNISLHPRACSLTEMLRMGLQGPPSTLKTLSAAAIGLSKSARAIGFIWICRAGENPLSAQELSSICAIGAGLANAIAQVHTPGKQTLSAKV
ncbi:MAG: hypothetical protein LLF76_10400 [Planctomycetaceae bacterium]|nr:hypothetical protein [Planctomycetaceae bacterium]